MNKRHRNPRADSLETIDANAARLLTGPGTTAAQRMAAAEVVAASALDADDAALLFAALGFDHDELREHRTGGASATW